MSREIKFRAWDKKKGNWCSSGNLQIAVTMHREWWWQFGYSSEPLDSDEYDNYEIMQFTGLLDKNGREIYEGDIVRIWFHEAPDGESFDDGVIRWHESSAAFKWFSGEPSDSFNYWLNQADGLGREVVGNIYENPELLEANHE